MSFDPESVAKAIEARDERIARLEGQVAQLRDENGTLRTTVNQFKDLQARNEILEAAYEGVTAELAEAKREKVAAEAAAGALQAEELRSVADAFVQQQTANKRVENLLKGGNG